MSDSRADDKPDIDPSWGATESGTATNIDLRAKVDEEIDTAKVPVYGRDEGMEAPPGDRGAGRDKFYDNYEAERAQESLYQQLQLFKRLQVALDQLLVGDVKDSYVDSLNRYLANLEVLAAVCKEYHFPFMIVELLRLPLWFPIKLLNLMKYELTWWIVTFVLCAIGLVFVGCALALINLILKGTIAYRQQHGDDDESDGASSA